MSMSAKEWDTLALLIEEGWPGEFTDAAAKAWRVLLDDYDAGQVLAAVKGLVARGGKFRPSVAEVVAQIRRDPSAPTFEEMYRLVYGPGGVLKARPAYLGPDSITPATLERAQLDRAAMLHPLVGEFVRRFTLGRLRSLEVDHPVYGEANRKKLRQAWDEMCESLEDRDIAALASGRRGAGLTALDPLAALGVSARPQIEAAK